MHALVGIAQETDDALGIGGLVVQRDGLAGQLCGAGIGIQLGLPPLAAVLGHQLQRVQQRVVSAAHAHWVGLPGMGFDQHHQPVAQREITAGKPRGVGGFDEAAGRVVIAAETWIEVHRQRALGRELLDDAVAQRLAGVAQFAIAHIHRVTGNGNIVAKFGAVGDVQVQRGQRVPSVHQRQHRAHFRGVGLHVVAVEVEPLGGDAKTHFRRAPLVGAVPGLEVFVAIDVEHRHEQEHLLVQQALARPALQQVAQQPEAGVLAVDLAGVDAALRQHHRDVPGLGIFGGQCTAGGHRQCLHRPALRAGAEIEAAHHLREGLLVGLAQRDHFVIAAGLLVARAFGQGGQLGFGGAGQQRRGGQQGKGEQGVAHGDLRSIHGW